MRIERVDDKTVKCFLSNEDLDEYDIDYKDFLVRSDKAKEVVQDIIEQAAAEVGYKPPKFAFDLQIVVLPEQGLLLTFSEKDPLDSESGAQLMQFLKEMKEMVQRAKAGALGGETANASALPAGEQSASQARGSAKTEKAEGNTQGAVRPEFAVFKFESLHDVLELAKAIPANLRVRSALYEMDEAYYLYIHKGTASYERYSRACVQALEFGNLYAAEPEKVLHLEEHGQCLIEEKALKKLRLN